MSAWDDRPGRTSAGDPVSTDDCVSDVTEFAALLTELKGRTERSYGSLARRVGMNTSTLHRYCAGEAVPQDFAPVERLAEFCGATPEERLELHRRWLRLAAARQRPRSTTAAASPHRAEAPGQAPDARHRSPDPHDPHNPDDPDDPHDPNDPDHAQDPSDAAERDEAPAAGGVRETRAAWEARETRDPAPGRAPARPWYRRRRTAVLAGAACALLITLGTLAALPGGGGGHRPPRASDDAVRSAAVPVVPSPGAAPARSSAPGRAKTTAPTGSAEPSPSPSPGRTRTSPVTEAAPAGGGAAAVPAAGVPLTWTADSQVWAQGCGHDYVIYRPPAQVPPPPMAQDAGAWASAQGAVHGRETNVEITLQGRGSAAVALTAVRVRVARRAAPAPGTAYAMDQGCGGSLSKRYFAVDLDSDRPVARSVAGDDGERTIPAVRLPYHVSGKDPEVLLVTARTQTCGCDWYLELDWSSGGRTGTVRVDDHGRPFRTTSIKGLPRYWYASDGGGARRWVPATD
ncbi:helix-turn-helix domain-containing protein [Streptomyces sp. NPDC048481]|uniref:helix-turn-helix domain-containing protein n=1 Tax=Streptomyces sp. NPDC048481 TaxID=3365557 RepID=UPI00371D9A50